MATLESSPRADIAPFWRKLHAFFVYPFHLTPMLAMGLGAGAFFIAQFLPFGVIIAAFVVTVSFVRYAYSVLERTAYGVLSSEDTFESSLGQSPYRPYKQLAALIIFSLVTAGVEALLGEVIAIGVYVVLTLAIPASVMALAMTDSLWQAINPAVLIPIIRTVGWPYLLLNFFVNLLSGSSFAAFFLFAGWVPPSLVLPIFAFLNMYFLLVMFHMLGYVLYQHHEKLGLSVRAAPGAASDPAQSEQDYIAQLIEENRINEALDIAYEAQRTRVDDLDAHERYSRLLGLANQAEKIPGHAQRFIPALLRKQRLARALEVFSNCRNADPAFRLQSSLEQFELARGAARQRQDKLAMQLLLSFDRNYPNSNEIPAAWLLQAKILTERLKQDKTALQMLRLLLVKYPQAEQAAEARQYVTALERLAQAAPRS